MNHTTLGNFLTLLDVPKFFTEGLGIYDFEVGRSLLRWPAELLYGSTQPQNIPMSTHAVHEHDIRDFEYKRRRAPLERKDRDTVAPAIDVELGAARRNIRNRGDRKPDSHSTLIRPNLPAGYQVAAGQRIDNPYIEIWELECLAATVVTPAIDPNQLKKGAVDALQFLAELLSTAPILGNEALEILTPEAVTAIYHGVLSGLWGYNDALQRYFSQEHEALRQNYDRLERSIRYNLELWRYYGSVPVLQPDGEIDTALTLANLATTLVAIGGLVQILTATASYFQGCDLVVSTLKSLNR